MNKEELESLKKWIMNLSEEEKKQRDLYLRELAIGKLQGAPVGYASIDKPWLKNYSEEAIASNLPKMKMYDYLYECNKNNLESFAIYYYGRKITYRELFKNIKKAMNAFAKLGLKKGDIVSLCIPTLPESIYAIYGLNRLGVTVNMIDPRINKEQIKESINETNSKYLLIVDLCHPKIDSILKETKIEKIIYASPSLSLPLLLSVGMNIKNAIEFLKTKKRTKPQGNEYIDWTRFIEEGKNYNSFDSVYEEDSPAIIVRTSGTTGNPKGVKHSNNALNALSFQYNNSGISHKIGDTFLDIMPVFLMYGLSCGMHMPLCLGMMNIIIPQVDFNHFSDLIIKYNPNHFMGIPAMYESLYNDKRMKKIDLSGLVSPGVGGDAVLIELEKKINSFLQEHNCPSLLAKGYGMTEVCAAFVVAVNSECNLLGSAGIPLPQDNVSVFEYDLSNDEIQHTDNELMCEKDGEICYCGPKAMLGYFNNPKETNKVLILHSDGLIWVHSGDYGYINRTGEVFVKGRIKSDKIARGDGHKFCIHDIEECLMKHPNILECAVVPIKDENYVQGFLPKAVIKITKNDNESEKEVIEKITEFCSHYLAARDSASCYEIVEKFPLNASGKIDRIFLSQNVLGNIYTVDANVESLIKMKTKIKK